MINQLPTYKKVGFFASILATVLMTGGLVLMFAIPGASKNDSIIGMLLTVPIVIGFICMLVAYFTGGIVEAFRMALNIGKWGWLVVPFPADIFTGIIATILALYVFIAFPVVPMYKSCKNYVMENGGYIE